MKRKPNSQRAYLLMFIGYLGIGAAVIALTGGESASAAVFGAIAVVVILLALIIGYYDRGARAVKVQRFDGSRPNTYRLKIGKHETDDIPIHADARIVQKRLRKAGIKATVEGKPRGQMKFTIR